jgi:hypothetical protein
VRKILGSGVEAKSLRSVVVGKQLYSILTNRANKCGRGYGRVVADLCVFLVVGFCVVRGDVISLRFLL